MDLIHRLPSRRALVLETEGLVCERLRRMLAEQGIMSCLVDHPALFHELREERTFDYYLVGIRTPRELETAGLTPDLEPLVLLVPPEGSRALGQYPMALPQATLVDRSLRDPDALRLALGSEPREAGGSPPVDSVRQTFASFGLSERQLEVLSCALLGESSAEIAHKLYISDLTVRNHLHAIYRGVGVSGRRELLGRFVRGLVANA